VRFLVRRTTARTRLDYDLYGRREELSSVVFRVQVLRSWAQSACRRPVSRSGGLGLQGLPTKQLGDGTCPRVVAAGPSAATASSPVPGETGAE